MSRRMSLAKFLAIAAVLGLAISCAPAGAPAPEGKESAAKPAAPAATPAPKTMPKLIIAKTYGGHDTFVPRIETADRKSDLELFYDYLVGSTPDLKLTVEGGLSKSWAMLPDGNGWTFELKKGIKFHDGSEVTAKDAKFSLECLLKEGSLSTNISYFTKALDKVDLVDDYTFTVHTKGRRVLFPHFVSRRAACSEGVVIPKDYVDKVGEKEFGLHPIGTGPYKAIELKPGQYIKYEAAGEKHWRFGPYPAKEITFTKVDEKSTRIAMLRTGEADIISLPLESRAEVEAAGFPLYRKKGSFLMSLHMQEQYRTESPLNKREVREALSKAINRKLLLEKVYSNEGELVGAHAQRLSIDWIELPPTPYDPKAAKELLKEAGYPNGFDIDFVSYVRTPVDSPLVVEAIAGDWAAIGVKAKIIPMDYATFRSKWQKKELLNTATMMAHPARYDSLGLYSSVHHSKGILPLTHDPKMDEILDRASAASSEEKRREVLQEYQKYIYNAYVDLPIALINSLFATRKDIVAWDMGDAGQSIELDSIRFK